MMARPNWWPMGRYQGDTTFSVMASQDGRMDAYEEGLGAMAKAIIGEFERLKLSPPGYSMGPMALAWEKLKREALGDG